MPLKKKLVAVAAAGLLAGAPYALAGHDDDGVDYPEGFRKFEFVRSATVTPDFVVQLPESGQVVNLGEQVPGIHNIYGNKKAMQGYRERAAVGPTKAAFKNGSVIVFDLWSPGELAGLNGAGKFIFQDQHLAVAVMEKDMKKYATTGGWGFQVFDPVTEKPLLNEKQQAECFACHKEFKANEDFVFSSLP
jgi:hypothetical protein